MNTFTDENQLQPLFNKIEFTPSERFYRRMKRGAWTPAGMARRRAWNAAGLTLLLAAAFVAFTPMGRAWAQTVFQFFQKAPGDTLPLKPWQMTAVANYQLTTTPVVETVISTPGPGYTFNLTVDEAGQKAGFRVWVPESVPDVLSYIGASYEPDHNIVRLGYRHTQYADAPNGLILREEKYKTNDDCDLCGIVGASQAIEKVSIGDVTGEYVEGIWYGTDNGPVWEGTPFVKTIRWQEDGMAFELMYMGIPDSVDVIDKDQMVSIAESLK